MKQWNLTITESTYQLVRDYLAQGEYQEELSKFVEKAVKQSIFRETVKQIQNRNEQCNQQEIMDIVDEATNWARETGS